MPVRIIRKFIQLEAAGGLLLIAAAAVAMVLANIPAGAAVYESILTAPVVVRVGDFALKKNVLLFINDGLMAVFFLLVALEIKRETIEGELRSWKLAALPVGAAFGGVAGPALIYSLINLGDPVAMHGWAIPAATDIAFALGVLALLGARVPLSLKIFLTTIAVVDDLVAIVIIAAFYTAHLSWPALLGAALILPMMVLLNRFNVRALVPYLLLGLALWVCVLKSGVHATLAGVAAGFCIPHRSRSGETSLLLKLEHDLHPWVTFLILPLFAFANAGLPLNDISLSNFLDPVPAGIALGLVLGKPIGIFFMSVLLIRLGLARMPESSTLGALLGIGLLGGIGFTMSLFIGALAFEQSSHLLFQESKLGILSGSLVSACLGYFWLNRVLGPRKRG